ncbi:MAG: hypothetical protein PF690_06700 [Deltaproteobacteria bacterium]|jgi:enoyl-CoA hydratase/carnithine racemase|nr:hypothetical protein [Deltaproteobacteria bacterium]
MGKRKKRKYNSEFKLRAAKLCLETDYHAEDMNYKEQFSYMNESFARLCTTDDAKEGVNAFFGKRNPVWQEK